jgi:hypothetical protein
MREARIASAALERLFCILFSSRKMLSRKGFPGKAIPRIETLAGSRLVVCGEPAKVSIPRPDSTT